MDEGIDPRGAGVERAPRRSASIAGVAILLISIFSSTVLTWMYASMAGVIAREWWPGPLLIRSMLVADGICLFLLVLKPIIPGWRRHLGDPNWFWGALFTWIVTLIVGIPMGFCWCMARGG